MFSISVGIGGLELLLLQSTLEVIIRSFLISCDWLHEDLTSSFGLKTPWSMCNGETGGFKDCISASGCCVNWNKSFKIKLKKMKVFEIYCVF